jgi:uncharacterized membrane protein YecN with MAPEG domain
MAIAPCYAAILGLLYIALSLRVIGLRRSTKVPLGDSHESSYLQRAVRAHANFAEYVPLALMLVAFAEESQLAKWLVHLLGVLLVLGRGLHAFGISQVPEDFRFRVTGMALTFSVIGLASLRILLAGPLEGLW